MELWVAVVIFALAVVGIIVSARNLKQKRALRIACIAVCAVLALAMAVYIGLTILFVEAVQNQPPAL